MRIIEQYKGIPLTIPSELIHGENCYTILTGKNGVGKSRLISELAREYTERYSVGREEYVFHNHYKSVEQPKVIAVSTSPFDKFPLYRKRSDVYEISNYRYVGMRNTGGFGGASAVSLIASAMAGLFEQLTLSGGYERLIQVFDVLGFDPEVQFVFKLNITSTYTRERYELNLDIGNELHDILRDIGISLEPRVLESLEGLDRRSITEIADAISFLTSFRDQQKMFSMEVDFSSSKRIFINKKQFTDDILMRSISVLLKNNIIRVMDVRLHKHEFGAMSLRRASSGEQCMLVIMLGIAGYINDNSLVLIDEPEISLHPIWQEKFTSLLIEVFSSYKGCQFIIATHSPQIVSNLNYSSCFVTSITKRKVYNSSKFASQSSDFQLAELFDAPGPKNEYITRLAFSLLSKVKKQKFVYAEDEDKLEQLLNFVPELKEDDAVLELIFTIKEVMKFYASN
ncbi:TPA: AAA family ATPase [Vibrio cholerae]|uniref:AAA family ATPase n=2 Tax=Vibrio cholerae TaxID=666 RepID=UPI001C54D68D|nr:AAA family ATPase [Vibrio cholerae]EJL6357659.1 AAA family ATPase [Vibrio cholerae]HDV5427617.1 AAA family ATPase [Vibrio cholerae]HDV5479684.1 AAA family ATPase [Vibrio cholerae]HDV5494470.1 AAA family ATPase [Vibrio cholerae]